jgi:hypothetical protein
MAKLFRSLVKIIPAVLLAPATKFRAENEQDIDIESESEIKTSINKIFLTSESLQSESFKIFSFDAEFLAK